MPDMPDMFDRLTGRMSEWTTKYPQLEPLVVNTERESTEQDESGMVTVTVRGGEVASISFDGVVDWADDTVTPRVIAAVNRALRSFWEEELAAAAEAQVPMGEVLTGLRELSADFRVAYEQAFERLSSYRV